jgi:hypothetical protein
VFEVFAPVGDNGNLAALAEGQGRQEQKER